MIGTSFPYIDLNQATKTPVAPRNGRKTVTLKTLRKSLDKELPLNVIVLSTSVEGDHVVYHLKTLSCTTKSSYGVAYRYSEFRTFRNQVADDWTCHDPECVGSCAAICEYITTRFPKKNLSILKTSARTVANRKRKFRNMLMHLLGSVLLTGSAMKCFHARENLPKKLFAFLGVADEIDQWSLLQVFVASNHSAAKTACTDLISCTICLEDVDEDEDSCCGSATSPIELPCGHLFHRECIFEWLLFRFHCPMCRARVGPIGKISFCRIKGYGQWWLTDLQENFLDSPAQ